MPFSFVVSHGQFRERDSGIWNQMEHFLYSVVSPIFWRIDFVGFCKRPLLNQEHFVDKFREVPTCPLCYWIWLGQSFFWRIGHIVQCALLKGASDTSARDREGGARACDGSSLSKLHSHQLVGSLKCPIQMVGLLLFQFLSKFDVGTKVPKDWQPPNYEAWWETGTSKLWCCAIFFCASSWTVRPWK